MGIFAAGRYSCVFCGYSDLGYSISSEQEGKDMKEMKELKEYKLILGPVLLLVGALLVITVVPIL